MDLKKWIPDVGRPKEPDEVYVDGTEVPDEPEGPYRARMAVADHRPAAEGIDVSEREVVTGRLQLLYRTRCPCGHQWDALDFQRLSLCPKCNRAVLVEAPTLTAG
jgi:hypothetical protein